MSWLLFLDESGHDHRALPYEVRGGFSIHAGSLWPLLQDLRQLEVQAFGAELGLFKKEIKGSSLLDRDRFAWAGQSQSFDEDFRQAACRGFLTKGLEKQKPTRVEFTAYGQACLFWAKGMFATLERHRAALFAAAIPRSVQRPTTFEAEEFLRKDHVFLFERFFYFLKEKEERGLLVMDRADDSADLRFARKIEAYFTKTQTGRERAQWIVPMPLFVASDLSYPVQIADVCIYCINWGARFSAGMEAEARTEILDEFGPFLNRLQFRGVGDKDGKPFRTYGIVCVPDPYEPRATNKKRR